MQIGEIEITVEVICERCSQSYFYKNDMLIDTEVVENEMQEDFDWKIVEGKLICDECAEELDTMIKIKYNAETT